MKFYRLINIGNGNIYISIFYLVLFLKFNLS